MTLQHPFSNGTERRALTTSGLPAVSTGFDFEAHYFSSFPGSGQRRMNAGLKELIVKNSCQITDEIKIIYIMSLPVSHCAWILGDCFSCEHLYADLVLLTELYWE